MASLITLTALPSCSSSTPKWIHEVFLSFYGQDTRKSFTDHLYDALKRKGILTFWDQKLKQGEYILEGLFKAIQESIFAIVVISRNYAFSKWCLMEVAEIVRCKKKMGLVVFPIFYHVDPSDVRKQTGYFAEAFSKHEKDPRIDTEIIQTWRDALTEVGGISGWHLPADRFESFIVRDITRRIFGELNIRFVSIYNNLVGIDSRVEEMMNLLHIGSDDVYFIGITGMSGIGKTTLAEVIYDRVSYQFEASCFIASVREKTINCGLVSLQKQLLSKILEEEVSIRDDREGLRMISNRLHSANVCIVLDDVDSEEQLEALARSHKMFGRGSRIIITSRDGHLLEKFADFIYPVEQLNNDEALQLFSLAAFKELHPENIYVDLSKSFVQYAQGLPLALKVLGSFLFGRTTVAWDAAWKELQENPKKKILDVLQIGFDALEDLQKKLFLDIACFFKGQKIDDIVDVIESFGFYPLINIEVLVERSLITISRERLINMHDLLQKMGQEIIRRESPDEPGRRSRLWHYKDVLRVLKDNSGTDAVEGIVLNLPIRVEERLSVKAFSQMKKLRILKIGGINITENFSEQLSTIEWDGDAINSMPTIEMRLMKWFGFPFISLPMDFYADNLVELNMRGSSIKQLWKGNKSLGSLKRLALSSSQSLMETPDFSKAQNLEMIDLEGCKSLTTVHPSIGGLKRLKQLDLSFCENFRELPDKISLESLEDFILSGCSRLEKFPDIVGNMTSLGLLYLDGTGIREVPPSFRNLSGLTTLSFRDCKKLLKLPINMYRLSTLRFLQLSGCPRLEKFPDISSMECLEELYAVGTAITQLSPNPFPRSIKTLRLTGFASSFRGIPVHQKLSNYNPLASTFQKELRCFSKKGYELTFYSLNKYNVLHVEVGSGSCEGTSTVGTKVMHGSLFTSHGMPDWFNNESGCVNSDLIKLPHLDNNRKWIGYAMFIEYDILSGHLPPGQYPHDKDYLRLMRTAYDWMSTAYNEDGYDLSDSNLVMFTWEFMNIRINVPPKRLHFFVPEPVWNTPRPEYSNVFRPEYSTKRGIWTYIPAQWFLEQFMNLDPLSDDIRSSGPTWTTAYPDFRVVGMNKWGAREVYEDNASEFFSSIAPPNLEPEFYSCLSYYFGKGSLGAQPPPLIDLVELRPGKKDVAEKGDFITLLKSEAIYNCIGALDIFGGSSSSSSRLLEPIIVPIIPHKKL